MPLESCMILLDCSEYMRNGDYVPTRLSAQQDAANLLVSAKTQSHPESTVGVSAGTELLVSPTDNVGIILNALHDVRLQQQQLSQDVCSAVQVASLALKHRSNKNGAQRIVLFVGSPVIAESRALIKAGRQLKKNNVGIDVVCMGELENNEDKMRELVDAANGRVAEAGADGAAAERTCHLVTIPAGVLPSDVLASSPILAAGGGGGYGAAAGGDGDGDFGAAGGGGGGTGGGGGGFSDYGVDPNMDPELAMALRVSMEEERARQERVAAAAAAEAGAGDGEQKSEDAEMTEAAPAEAKAAPTAADMGLSEEEALLQQALAMSMNENEPADEAKTGEDSKPAAMDVEDEDSAMQMALQMSMQNEAAGGDSAAASAEFQDPAFVNELLGSMPGVDPNDPEIQQALRQAVKAKKAVEDEKKKKQEEDKKE
jgi:26S proteasome regulatory subunit N10